MKKYGYLILYLYLMGGLSGCNLFGAPAPTATPNILETLLSYTPTTVSSPLPTDTSTSPVPTATLTPSAVPQATSTTVPTGRQHVDIYLIAIGDNGASGEHVGANDSAVPVTVNIESTKGVLRAALNQLLAVDTEYYGQSGLYNALYLSDLSISSLYLKEGIARVYLTGDLTIPGDLDSPRIEAQLELTALQFSTVCKVTVYINGVELEEVLYRGAGK